MFSLPSCIFFTITVFNRYTPGPSYNRFKGQKGHFGPNLAQKWHFWAQIANLPELGEFSEKKAVDHFCSASDRASFPKISHKNFTPSPSYGRKTPIFGPFLALYGTVFQSGHLGASIARIPEKQFVKKFYSREIWDSRMTNPDFQPFLAYFRKLFENLQWVAPKRAEPAGFHLGGGKLRSYS